MRARRNPISDVGIQIAIAGATAVVTTTVAVLITNWLTKKSTTEDIATGKQPLPPGSKPTTTGPPGNVTPVTQPQPQPQPQPKPLDLQAAATIAQGINAIQGYMGPSWSNSSDCPQGYEKLDSGDCVKSQ